MNPAKGYMSRTDALRCHPQRALTTNHLPRKANPWLQTSLQVPARNANAPAFQRSKARSLKAWNSCPQTPDTQSGSCSKTEHISAAMLSHPSQFFLNCQTGKPKTTNLSTAGELFTVSDLSNIKPEPAERRVLYCGSKAHCTTYCAGLTECN